MIGSESSQQCCSIKGVGYKVLKPLRRNRMYP
ncbi:MAG: hypothetical protein ACI965_001990 [Paraglaciecola sp.]